MKTIIFLLAMTVAPAAFARDTNSSLAGEYRRRENVEAQTACSEANAQMMARLNGVASELGSRIVRIQKTPNYHFEFACGYLAGYMSLEDGRICRFSVGPNGFGVLVDHGDIHSDAQRVFCK